MGGSGRAGYFDSSMDDLKKILAKAESSIADKEFSAEVNGYLAECLTEYNDRDTELTARRLDAVREALSAEHEVEFDIRFAGSVSKRTYVEGISDVDALVFVDGTDLAVQTPAAVREHLVTLLRRWFPNEDIGSGKLAVTIQFDDVPLQLLPALRQGAQTWISAPDGSGWAEIDGRGFADALTRCNRENGTKVVPVVKLAKAIVASLPSKQQLTGYHVESLAVDVFRGYQGETSLREMLHHFFSVGSARVLSPIVDSTGQSVHVDDYLGSANSDNRRLVSDAMARMGRKLKLAHLSKKMDAWRDIFESQI